MHARIESPLLSCRRRLFCWTVVALAGAGVWPAPNIAAEPTADAAATAELPPPLTHYLGREIAPFMSYHGADWLVRASREQEESCAELLAALGIKPGQTVCDLGCGNGYYTLKMATLVGAKGKVYAVDIQPEMLSLLDKELEASGTNWVEPILGTVADPKLPAGTVDLILLVDVYHEFSHPEPMLQALRKSLSPSGRIALAEFRAEDPSVPIKPLHKMSKEQILKEYGANGLRLVGQYDKLPWQHLMFFAPAEAKQP
ncbi:MAG: methyltransferase domain-containing protein [Pirellulales bacterium]|nr:methyltransferase domain-containing protein [Pirellulales bacterium]